MALASWQRSVSIAGPLRLGFLDEVVAAGGIEKLARNNGFAIAIPAHVDDLRDQVARMAGAHLQLARAVILAFEILDHHRIEREAAPLAVQFEDAAVLVKGRVLGENLVR